MSVKKPDPYRIDAGVKDDGGAAPPPREINPSFDVLERRGIYVVTLLRSDMLDAHEIEQLGGDLRNYFAKKHKSKVVLDLHGVRHLSSAALGMLITLKSAIESTGGALRLACVRDELQQIFKMTKLHKVLKMKESVDAAVASL